MDAPDSLDAGLDMIHPYRSEYGGGLTDHSPMVIEALDHAGRSAEIAGWLARYSSRLDPAEGDDPALAASAAIASTIEDQGWRPVLVRHLLELEGGMGSAAGHGLLRTAHAVRALGRADTRARRQELARGLEYWRRTYRALPPVEPRGEASPTDVLASLEPLPDPPSGGMISTRLARVADPGFLAAAAAVSLPSDPPTALTEVTSAAARALGAAGPAGVFAVLRSLTTSVAVRDLLTLVDPARATRLVVEAWTVVAGLWRAFGEGRPLIVDTGPGTGAEAGPPTAAELVDRGVRNGDDHAIKVAVAVWTEERATGGNRPDLRAAAATALDHFGA